MNELEYASQLRHLSDAELSLLRWHVLFDDQMAMERRLVIREIGQRIRDSRKYPVLDIVSI